MPLMIFARTTGSLWLKIKVPLSTMALVVAIVPFTPPSPTIKVPALIVVAPV